ncbi:putative 95 family protein [Chlamydia ibidis]|uniref:S-adenosylmethionine-dependent methyltransferase family protein n=2 Tax=Chlamydia ibidis TaxID=1405396 RepID=A0ABN0N0J0_9CHLA|nr:class I SAM-dependent methyltransferase [Chlamydia ibidis]EPP35415.1 putative 95 family protein [Chlamydia ibidis]EQM63046.1 S-adenosylmethionine-dependent methyltransferase family protein [Chlamydia ibidis 10-1398/6]
MDYKLLDCGEGKKLESFGRIKLVRPCYSAIWPKRSPNLWKDISAEYRRLGEDGEWNRFSKVPEEWRISLEGVDCTLKLTPFGHVGIFPEHTGFWPALREAIKHNSDSRVLNLFAYTGASSIFSAKCGARVCHVDASKAAVRWAHKNVENNALPDKRIFWVIEDVFSFLKKEIRRGKTYDIILLDPPTYGRGPEGEVFKIDRDFFSLLSLCSQLLSKSRSYFLVTSHTPGYTPEFLRALVQRAVPQLNRELWSCGESFCGKGDEILPSGVFAQWSL